MDRYLNGWLPTHCQRCHEKTNTHTMSWFNTQMICMACSDKEMKHPRIKEAKDAERAQVKAGNRNFVGIGLPEDLR